MDLDSTTAEILAAALASFGSSGFEGTTMRQVADTAGVSRPTLYARYNNKTALFRAVVERVYDVALEDVAKTIAAGGAFSKVFGDILHSYYGSLFDQSHGLPRVDELKLVQSEQAADLIEAARKRIRSQLTQFLRDRTKAGDIAPEQLGIPISQLVELTMLTPLSLKQPGTTSAQYRKRLANFAKIMARALEAR